MKLKHKYLLLSPFVLFLIGCSEPLGGAFSSEINCFDFENNYFYEWDATLKQIDNVTVPKNIWKHVDGFSSTSPNFNETVAGKYMYDNEVCLNDTNFKGLKDADHKYNNIDLQWNIDKVADNAKEEGYGPNKCLSNIDESFSYGYLSKLYDGRLNCFGYFERSRVQIDKNGFSTFFPKSLQNVNYLGISLRGGTTIMHSGSDFPHSDTLIDLSVSFYTFNVRDEANKYIQNKFVFKDIPIMVDNSGQVTFLTYYFTNEEKESIKNASGMSITFDLVDTRAQLANLDTDRNTPWLDKNDPLYKDHFALMLYEFLLPDSTWL